MPADQRAEAAAGHHHPQHLGALRLGEDLGHQWNADDDFGAGADTGEEAQDAEHRGALREALQRGEYRDDGDAQRQGADAADIIGDDAEEEAAQRPAEQADHGEDAADPADIGDSRIAAHQFCQGRVQHKGEKPEIGAVEGPSPARPPGTPSTGNG